MWKRILIFLQNLFGKKKKEEIDVDIGQDPVDNTVCQVFECEILDIEEIDETPYISQEQKEEIDVENFTI